MALNGAKGAPYIIEAGFHYVLVVVTQILKGSLFLDGVFIAGTTLRFVGNPV